MEKRASDLNYQEQGKGSEGSEIVEEPDEVGRVDLAVVFLVPAHRVFP
jgi:hypothetical protein